jgi:hypothetical protein
VDPGGRAAELACNDVPAEPCNHSQVTLLWASEVLKKKNAAPGRKLVNNLPEPSIEGSIDDQPLSRVCMAAVHCASYSARQ